jgi:stress-induced morphogen
MITAKELEDKLRSGLPHAKIRAHDMTGGGDHWQVSIEAQEFEGLGLVEQHQLVYRLLGDWMHHKIHALSMNTSAPKKS